MIGCTNSPVSGAATHSSGTCSSPAPSVWNMRLTLAFCSAKPNCRPRNPKHMFQICQNDRCGLAAAAVPVSCAAMGVSPYRGHAPVAAPCDTPLTPTFIHRAFRAAAGYSSSHRIERAPERPNFFSAGTFFQTFGFELASLRCTPFRLRSLPQTFPAEEPSDGNDRWLPVQGGPLFDQRCTHRHPHLLVPRLPIHRRRQRHREHLLPERGGDGER